MGIKFEIARVEDAAEIGAMLVTAYTAPRIALETRDCDPEELLAWSIARMRIEIGAAVERPDVVVALKAVDDESKEIVGYAVWAWDGTVSDTVYPALANLPLPAGTNTTLRAAFVKEHNELEEKCKPNVSPLYELLQVSISPKFQRRGIASQLVAYGLKKADEQKVPVFLTGTPAGAPLYRKLGFEDVGSIEIGLEPYGGEGSHVHVAMIRKARE